jgi:hypothetical protein
MSLITFYTTPFVVLSPPPAVRSAAFSSDGNQIAVGYENGYIEIYQTMLVISFCLGEEKFCLII